MKTHFAYISFIIICTLSMGWLAASHSSKSTDKTDAIRLLEREIVLLRYLANQPEIISKTLRTAYPRVPEYRMRSYAQMIYELSNRYGLSWSLISATIWVESNFNPDLQSPKNAKGLMQLLENTAAGQALKMGIRYHEDETLWDDITNLFLGVRYLLEAFEKERDYQRTTYYYLAGPQWRKTIMRNERVRGYMESYALNVLREKERLELLFSNFAGNTDSLRLN